jgi:hypothetical protein
MLELLAECGWFVSVTNGVFSPLVLNALEDAGYDTSFERVEGVDAIRPVSVPSFDSLSPRSVPSPPSSLSPQRRRSRASRSTSRDGRPAMTWLIPESRVSTGRATAAGV